MTHGPQYLVCMFYTTQLKFELKLKSRVFTLTCFIQCPLSIVILLIVMSQKPFHIVFIGALF